jgi:ribulose-phosphate 3-epimerase
VAKVIPAILTGDPDSLSEGLRQVESFTDEVQIDVMDGIFVPSRSVGAQVLSGIKAKLLHEAHLMVTNPDRFAAALRHGGFTRAVFHIEAAGNPKKVINILRSQGLEVGIALNPETPNEKILPFLRDISLVLFLTVDPGFYGSPFIPEVLTKVRSLRANTSSSTIGVDGGINEKNIRKVVEAGADRIYVGSHVFLTRDPKISYQKLNRLAHGE